MSLGLPDDFRAWQVLRINRIVADLDAAEQFYRRLGFQSVSRQASEPAVLRALGVAHCDAMEVVLRVGQDEIALVALPGAQPYPAGSRSDDRWFQHLAIVVADMPAAFAQLSRLGGWRPITQEGPQLLPPSNGAVRAYKFRDPDGHPLELIWFPAGQGRAIWHGRPSPALFLGIDHSAIAVASTEASVAFYETLGMDISGDSFNRGPAQGKLDGLDGAAVQVTALRPGAAEGPGLELLQYHPLGRAMDEQESLGIATDWVTIAGTGAMERWPLALRDPDGHWLVLVSRTDAPPPPPTDCR